MPGQNCPPVLPPGCRGCISYVSLLGAEKLSLNKMDSAFLFMEPLLEIADKPVVKQVTTCANNDNNEKNDIKGQASDLGWKAQD